MKQSSSAATIFIEILNILEAGNVPGADLLKRARAAIRAKTKQIRAATAAAAASGKSGRPAKYDREAIKAAKGSHQEIADQFGCSPTLVSIMKKEAREEAAKKK